MTWHMQADSRLYALGARLNGIAGVDAILRDNTLTVTRGDLTQRITCAPRPSDGDRLWFWDAARKPVAEADNVIDAAVTVNGRLQGGTEKTGPSPAELDGDVSDVIVTLEQAFPGWHVIRTSRGVWWATRGILASETLVPDGRTTVKAGTAAEMYVRLESANSGRIVTAAPADVNDAPTQDITGT